MVPRYNEVPRDWQDLFTITWFRYIEVLFHILYWGKENCSIFTEVRYMEVPLYFSPRVKGQGKGGGHPDPDIGVEGPGLTIFIFGPSGLSLV